MMINHIFDVLTTTEILILSSVLCATDTVAANSLIKAEKFPVLNAVLFGEGILNDAVAIILYGTVSKLRIDEIGGELTYLLMDVGSKWYRRCFWISLISSSSVLPLEPSADSASVTYSKLMSLSINIQLRRLV